MSYLNPLFCKKRMELSFMVLCKIDKYYNQVKFEVLWPRLKVVSSTVTFKVKIQ